MDAGDATTPRPAPPPGARALEDEVAGARARHRQRLGALARIADEARAPWVEAPSPSVLQWLRERLFGAAPLRRSLEDELEDAQRRVSQLAHALDFLAADRAEVRREVEALDQRIAAAHAAAAAAADRIAALDRAIDAALGSELDDPRLPSLEAERVATEGDRRAHVRVGQRLAAIQRLHAEHLAAVEGFERGLTALHDAGTEVLEALDAELATLATEERARQLASAVARDLRPLRDRVARVNRMASEGAVLLTEHLDRLADEVDLLAPADPAALEAEREISVYLRDRSPAEAVARARLQAALRARRRDRDGD